MKQCWGNFSMARAVAVGLPLLAAVSLTPQLTWAEPSAAAVENRLREMEEEMRMLRQELQGLRAEEPAQQQQIQQMQQQMQRERPPKLRGSMIFFRGGYTELREDRAFNSFSDTHGILGVGPVNREDKGWYVGAGVEHLLTRDLWGMVPGTWALAEIGLEWKNLGTEKAITVVPFAECLLGNVAQGRSVDTTTPAGLANAGGCAGSARGDINLTMFTVSASPKIKFMEGSPIRPWIIPAGLDFHVISPPSDAATVLDLGVQFAAGVDFEILPGIKLGIDGRYHYAADFTDSNAELSAADISVLKSAGLTNIDTDQDNDNWVAGGYLGIEF